MTHELTSELAPESSVGSFQTLEELRAWGAGHGVDLSPLISELIARRAATGGNPVPLAQDPSFMIESVYSDVAEASRWARQAGFDLDPLLQELLARRQRQNSGDENAKRMTDLYAAQLKLGQEDAQRSSEHAKAYNSAIVGIGYAGYFALWGGYAGKISAAALSITGLFMMVSMLSFVLIEVYGGYLNARYVVGVDDLICRTGSDQQKIEALRERDDLIKCIWRRYRRIWAVSWSTSVIFGLLGAATLTYDAAGTVLGFAPIQYKAHVADFQIVKNPISLGVRDGRLTPAKPKLSVAPVLIRAHAITGALPLEQGTTAASKTHTIEQH